MYATPLPRSNWLRRASIRLAWYRHMPASSLLYFREWQKNRPDCNLLLGGGTKTYATKTTPQKSIAADRKLLLTEQRVQKLLVNLLPARSGRKFGARRIVEQFHRRSENRSWHISTVSRDALTTEGIMSRWLWHRRRWLRTKPSDLDLEQSEVEFHPIWRRSFDNPLNINGHILHNSINNKT